KLLQRMIAHQKLLQTVERRGFPREIVEALVAAGVDRDSFVDREKLEALSSTLSSATRTVSVQRDEEHNRYSFNIEDRTNGYPRQPTIAFGFPPAPESRTLLFNRRDMPAVGGELIVNGSEDAGEVKLNSIDALVEFFVDAGKKGVAINRYKGL